MSTKKGKHPDILFIQKRLDELIKNEEYEKASILKRWLESLKEHHGKKVIKKNNKRRTS
jgi:protein-arginine kinase activator protein McsA